MNIKRILRKKSCRNCTSAVKSSHSEYICSEGKRSPWKVCKHYADTSCKACTLIKRV